MGGNSNIAGQLYSFDVKERISKIRTKLSHVGVFDDKTSTQKNCGGGVPINLYRAVHYLVDLTPKGPGFQFIGNDDTWRVSIKRNDDRVYLNAIEHTNAGFGTKRHLEIEKEAFVPGPFHP